MLEMLAQSRSALVCGDVALEGDASRDRLDWGEIDTDDKGMRGHNLRECLVRWRRHFHEMKHTSEAT
jgi:hypothetical protein